MWSNVAETRLGTVLRGPDGSSVGVVEHLMSALAGAGIDDCTIDVEGPEPPLLDGDALSFLVADRCGRYARARHRVSLSASTAPSKSDRRPPARSWCPLPPPSSISRSIFRARSSDGRNFPAPSIRETFRREIAPARTFGFLKEAEHLRAAGYGRGADLTNTLVIDGDALVNPALQRFPDEFVRHKILDAIGDLKLAGLPVIARFEGRKSSHALNNQLLRALFADPANYRVGTD